MHVLQVMASGARGGGADHLLGVMPALRQLGVTCEAAAGENGPLRARLIEQGFVAHPIDLMGGRLNPRGPRELAKLMAKVGADVVHFHGTRAAFFGAAAAALLRNGRAPRATVYTAHGLSYRKEMSVAQRAVYLGVEALACRSASRVISVSKTDLIDLQRRRFVAADRGLHVPNCVDTDRYAPGDRAVARQRTGMPAEGFIVGTTSRLVPQKSVADLIDAVAVCPEIVLAIAGDGELRVELEARARPHAERILFLGSRDDVPELLRAWDVFALSSRWEGEPISLLEALASGLPCVATSTEGATEVLEATSAGVLVDIGDSQGLAAALRELHGDASRVQRMGTAGRDAVGERRFPFAAERMANLYAEALAENR